ncbi:MAG TPA: choice-of-anchor D domain-containing protein, partial [Polyangiaceae bacterium]|nr:choice-of-anchor D domain-containing protein [Polyangiaceae bacterium]
MHFRSALLEQLQIRGFKLGIVLVASVLLAAQCTDARLSISPQSADFGRTVAGSSSLVTFTFTNSGGADAILGPVTQAGLQLSDPFSVAGGTCRTGAIVPADGGTCTLVLRFSPTTIGFPSDSFTLTYNWEESGVDVRGATGYVRGEVPGLEVPSVIFDEVFIGESKTQNLVLTNYHQIDATFQSITLFYAEDSPFVITGGTCAPGVTIAAGGGTCTMQITYSPRQGWWDARQGQVAYTWADGAPTQPASLWMEG